MSFFFVNRNMYISRNISFLFLSSRVKTHICILWNPNICFCVSGCIVQYVKNFCLDNVTQQHVLLGIVLKVRALRFCESDIFYPCCHEGTCVYQGVKNVPFWVILRTSYRDGPIASQIVVFHQNVICSIYQFEQVWISSVALGLFVCNFIQI